MTSWASISRKTTQSYLSPYGRPTAFNRKPALLQVDLQGPSSLTPRYSLIFDVFNEPHPHQSFKQLTNGCDLKQVQFSVRFDPRVGTMPDVRESLLLCLRAIRGVGNTTVTGIETSTASELATLMMTPITSIDEVLELADAYQRWGDRQLALGHIVDAARSYIGGVEYVNWAIVSCLWKGLLDNNFQSLWELAYRRWGIYIDCAVCNIKLGHLNHALHVFQKVMTHQLPDIQRAKAHYHSGLAFLQLGKDSSALTAFVEAIKAQPGHEGANKEIDSIERNARMKELRKENPIIRDIFLPPATI